MKSFTLKALWLVALFVAVACSKDDDDDGNTGTNNPDLPSAIAGEQFTMKVTFEDANAPYALGDEALFTFSSSGALFIDLNPAATDGDEIQVNTVTLVDNEYEWNDQGGFIYRLSLTADNTINEVNVFDQDNTFLNQWTPVQTGSNPALELLKEMAGTYNVSNVLKGSHSRMTVTIGADGSINFDDNVALDAADYVLITDRSKTPNVYAILVDIAPYPTEPYERIVVKVDENDNTVPTGMEYNPSYPNVSGRVEVEF